MCFECECICVCDKPFGTLKMFQSLILRVIYGRLDENRNIYAIPVVIKNEY